MNKHILSLLTLAILGTTSTAYADYIFKIPLEKSAISFVTKGSGGDNGNGSGGTGGTETGGSDSGSTEEPEVPVTPEEPTESRCVAYKQSLINIASTQALPVEVRYYDDNGKCLMITKSIAGFASLAKLRAYGKSALELGMENYELAVLNLAVTRGDILLSDSISYISQSQTIWYTYQYDKTNTQQ